MVRAIPEIFVPKSGDNKLDRILLEEDDNFEIFWYHWHSDGPPWFNFMRPEEDLEPVILVYDDEDKLCCVITRRHWEYQDYYVEEDGLAIPLTILFDGDFHPPYPKTADNTQWFEDKISNMDKGNLKHKIIKPEDVSPKFRIGKSHKTLVLRPPVDDPSDIARQIIALNCTKV